MGRDVLWSSQSRREEETLHVIRSRKRLEGWDLNQAWETTGTSVAVSTVIGFTGTASTDPAMRTRRDEKDKEKSIVLCASLVELYHTWSEFIFFFPNNEHGRAGA